MIRGGHLSKKQGETNDALPTELAGRFHVVMHDASFNKYIRLLEGGLYSPKHLPKCEEMPLIPPAHNGR